MHQAVPVINQQSNEGARRQAVQSGGPEDVTPKETMTEDPPTVRNLHEPKPQDDFVIIEKKQLHYLLNY